MADSYLEYVAKTLNSLPIDKDKHNVIFVNKGRYKVVYKDLDECTFDELIDRLLAFNSNPKHTSRCLMVKSPNWLLRGLEYFKRPTDFIGPMPLSTAMVTFCAPMKANKPQATGFKALGRLGDDYLIPDRRQVAAEMVNDNKDLVEVAKTALEASSVTLNGKLPFEGAPLFVKFNRS